MNELFNLQNEFQEYLLHLKNDFQKQIISTEKVPAEDRLSIYSNAYRLRLHEALAANYPMLQMYLGDEKFDELAYAFIDAHPSSFRSIRWFGDKLPDFILDYYQEFPHLNELAQFEWTQTLVFDAKNGICLKAKKLSSIPPTSWANMQLIAHPSIRRLNFSWNAVEIWQALFHEQTPPEPIQISLQWVLWRKDLTNHFYSISDDEAWAIDAMLNKATFGEICEGLCQWVNEDEAGLRAASLLKGWITEGLIEDVKV